MSAVPMPAAGPADDLVVVKHLSRHFGLGHGQFLRAVDDVSLTIRRGETYGLVGESGSGKSTLARLLLRLDRPTLGHILFDGVDLGDLSARDLRRLRRRMQIVFQDPFASLNRRRSVREIIETPLHVHRPAMKKSECLARVNELLDLVGLRQVHANAYPRQLSGGQCQRVSIARALAINPEFVVLDEAVSAVDVSIQAQILNLLRDLQQRFGLTYLFVSHDLSVVRYMSETIGVMYHGALLEQGVREVLFTSPKHPCTHALLASIPSSELFGDRERAESHAIIREEETEGQEVVEGCRFHPRCPLGRREICSTQEPAFDPVAPGHFVACHFPQSADSLLREAATEADR